MKKAFLLLGLALASALPGFCEENPFEKDFVIWEWDFSNGKGDIYTSQFSMEDGMMEDGMTEDGMVGEEMPADEMMEEESGVVDGETEDEQ